MEIEFPHDAYCFLTSMCIKHNWIKLDDEPVCVCVCVLRIIITKNKVLLFLTITWECTVSYKNSRHS
jgi:hypothetical protein